MATTATAPGDPGGRGKRRSLVTGASAGIGRATALALARRGDHVLATGRREARLDALAEEAAADPTSSGRIEPLVFDLTDRRATEAALEGPAAAGIDVLVNNAGLARGVAPLQEGDVDDWEAMIDTNLRGLLYATRAVLPGMVARGRGDIVNVGSVAGRWVYPGGNVYCATKYAVGALSEALRLDVQGTGLRVTNVLPGMVETEFSQVRLGDAGQAAAVYEGMTPLSGEDIAETILWALDRPPHVTIQELVVFPTDQAGVGPGKVHRRSSPDGGGGRR
ncbi:MAG TPA: SDR family NAD(P)-dependent oxidoreductase [Polyangiaceae bacterium LLY-WYZ-14_1]|nr:SDR family NAD(P)-dependent oxidoreductase [Polyangiaceae bacterium LLY-WYZ-14_1]